jgi:hypothetical protein
MESDFTRKESSTTDLKSNRLAKKESAIGLQSNVTRRGDVAITPPVPVSPEERREYEKHAKKELEHLKLVLSTHEKLHALLKLGVASANTLSQLLVLMEDDPNQYALILLSCTHAFISRRMLLL